MASREDISAEINALAVHCRPPLMSADERAAWTVDWINDLSGFPLDAVQIGFRKWRHSGSVKFPTPGQLLPMVRESLPAEKTGTVEVWRELSDSEYRALTIREKIRHCTILAHEARLKAGPMYRSTTPRGSQKFSGQHLTPEDMPDTWRRWTAIAEGHEDEAKRLRGILRAPMSAAAA